MDLQLKPRRRFLARIVVALAGLLLVLPAGGQSAADASGFAGTHPVLIGPGDLLNIAAYDTPELTQTVRVESDGGVNLLLLGQTKIAGMTAAQAGKWIEDELVRRNFQVKPHVTVLIAEFASQAISVTGEVSHPGIFPIMSTRSVLDAISLAGGFTPLADTRVTIKHRLGNEETVTVNLKTDRADDALAANVVIYPGDIVVVPRAGIVYVLGEVGRPGGIVMQDNGRITILQALAQAGGSLYTASQNGAYLLHKGETGYVSTRVKVGDLLKGQGSDFELSRNDILYIPPSTMKHIAGQTSSLVQTVAGAAVYHSLP